MDIQKVTTIELKASFYDQLALKERCEANMKIINEELASRAQQAQSKKTMEEETKSEPIAPEMADEMEATNVPPSEEPTDTEVGELG